MVLINFNTSMGELYLESGMYLILNFILVNASSVTFSYRRYFFPKEGFD